MKKLTLRVSGTRVGDAARPAEDLATTAVPQKRFGLRAHRSVLAPVAAAPLRREDYAMPDDYEGTSGGTR